MILEDLRGFKRPVIDTTEHIFPLDSPEKEIKVNRNKNINLNIRVKRKKQFKQKYDDNVKGIISPRGSGKISLEKKLPSKPCNSNFRLVKKEARKNAHLRYYFENNMSQWAF